MPILFSESENDCLPIRIVYDFLTRQSFHKCTVEYYSLKSNVKLEVHVASIYLLSSSSLRIMIFLYLHTARILRLPTPLKNHLRLSGLEVPHYKIYLMSPSLLFLLLQRLVHFFHHCLKLSVLLKIPLQITMYQVIYVRCHISPEKVRGQFHLETVHKTVF